MSFAVNPLTYEAIQREADNFLRKYHPTRSLPVPIETIVDIKLKIDIVPMGCLLEICDVDAFINTSCTVIHVDCGVYVSANQNRYRVSLAHELAHSILHRDFLKSVKFDSLGEWKTVYTAIPKDQQEYMELQAFSLGANILVPRDQLDREYDAALASLGARQGVPAMRDINLHSIETELSNKFGVSREVIRRRCEKDNLTKA
jgi:IrrE N-terminal-like domain